MSVIGNNHSFVPFISGKSQAADDSQVLLVVTFKGADGKAPEHDSQCASVPKLENWSQQEMDALRPHINAMVHKARVGIARAAFLAGRRSVQSEEVAMPAVLQYLNAKAEGTRITPEEVEVWFDVAVRENLKAALEMELGVSADSSPDAHKVVAQKLNQYRGHFVKLPNAKDSLNAGVIQKLRQKLQECAPENDQVTARCLAKLVAMESKNAQKEAEAAAM